MFQIDIIIEYSHNQERELVKNVQVERVEKTGEILLTSVVRSIRDLGFQIDG